MKRLMDVLISAFAVAVLLAPCLVIALLIRLTSKGPSIHWSQRVGRDGQNFWMPKFRTMSVDTPLVATALLESPEGYVTGLGKILRATSIDELPQFYSVIRGDMSLVGPRPVILSETELLAKRLEAGVQCLSPGITGLAQINGRDHLSVDEKVALDKEYLLTHTIGLDLKILWKTCLHILSRKDITH